MKKFFLMLVVALCSVSCEFIGSIVDELKGSHSDNMIYLSFEQFSDLEVDQMAWRDSDEVSVFYNNSGNSLWEIDEIDEGVATFVEHRVVEGVEELDCVVVAYPYSDDYEVVAAEQNLYVTIPAIQSNTDIHRLLIASGEGDEFTLKNVCGRLNLKVTGEKKVVKMTLRSDDDVQIAGRVAINYVDYTLSLITDGSLTEEQCVREVILDLGDGVQLSDTPTDFYFVIAQQTLPSSMTVTLTYDDGTTGTIKVRRLTGPIIQLPIEGVVIPGAGDGSGDDNTGGDDNQGGEITADAKTIYYTTTDGNIIDIQPADFDANISSHTYENDLGIISFNGPITMIGKGAFQDIKTLETITLPISITSIGDSAFAGCDALTTAKIPNSVTELGYGIFDSCISLVNVSLGNSIPAITRSMFYDCFKLTKIVIPDSVKTIEDFAFGECYRLSDVKFGSNVESIGSWVFDQNIRLEKITLPHKLVSLGDGVFVGCKSLQSVTMGEYVNSVGVRAFHGCESLKEFNTSLATADKRGLIIDGELKGFAPADITAFAIPDNVTAIGAYVFYECKNLAGVTIPSSVRTIGELAFCMSSLQSVFIPHSVTTINASAFASCNSLESLTLANGVTTICEKAFTGCSKLTEVSLPVSIESIQSSAFSGCSALKSVYSHSQTPPAAGNNIFNRNAADRKIYVHPLAVESYQTASGWSKYASSIEGKVF